MPYTTSVAGTTITASWANANVRDQTISPFATAAARDSAITAPIHGQMAYTQDTSTLWVFTAGVGWVSHGASSGWIPYTPTWTAFTTNPTIGNGTLDGSYQKVGRMVSFRARILVGTTTTVGSGTYFVSVPFATSAATPIQLASGMLNDASASTWYRFQGWLPTSSNLIQFPTGDGTVAQWNAAAPVVLANGDNFIVTGTYEAAS
jgi:hypothetical protein